MTSSRSNAQPVTAHLSLWDTVSIIIGIVVGAGIYETAPLVFENVSGPLSGLGVWVLGGLLSLVGALCYAELATTYPRSGGDYVYLTKAYGSWAGFLYGWCQLAVLMTGSIGMTAYIFANYAARFWDFGNAAETIYAVGAVSLLSLVNIMGVVFGKGAQNVLTALKVVGLGGILAVGFLWPSQPSLAAHDPIVASGGSLGLAMILVLYTYGGWNDAALVAAEVSNQRRNIPRALILGTLLLMVIYVVINLAYLWGLGFAGAKASKAIAADMFQRPLGDFGPKAMSLIVMISALGAVNGLIYTGSRIYSTLGEDYRLFSSLARWHPERRSPVWSLGAQALCTLVLILGVGSAAGRSGINAVLEWLGIGAVSWEGHGGFDTLLRCTAPVFWLFFFLTGAALYILRVRDSQAPRPFRVPLYPWLPLVFCGMCLYMFYSAVVFAGKLVLVGIVPLIIGLLLYWLCGRSLDRVPDMRANCD